MLKMKMPLVSLSGIFYGKEHHASIGTSIETNIRQNLYAALSKALRGEPGMICDRPVEVT